MTELLKEIWELLEQEKVACPEPATSWQHPGYDIGRSFACERCDGTELIPNPAYDPLREVVREERVLVVGRGLRQAGYIPRSWADKPGWWLATLLVQAGIKAGILSPLSNSHLLEDLSLAAEAVLAALSAQRTPGAEKEGKDG